MILWVILDIISISISLIGCCKSYIGYDRVENADEVKATDVMKAMCLC